MIFQRTQLKQHENGLVSIIVTMIFLIVLSLIVLGFAQIARREQRGALDRQLSTQAFYAAESGINVAKKAINSPGNIYSSSSPVPADKTTCAPGPAPLDLAAYQLDNDSTKTTCILINQKPEQLDWSSINPTKSKVTPIKAFKEDGSKADFSEITIDWQNENGQGTSFLPGNNFPKFGDWNSAVSAPVLRVELIPMPALGDISRDTLIKDSFTAFLRPTSDPTATDTVSYSDGSGAANRGKLVAAKCVMNPATGKKCKVTINGLNAHHYYLRMKTEYQGASVSMTAKYFDGVGLQIARIGGAQVEIDATGKAVDVLKRIRVKMPYKNNNYLYPESVLESGDAVCKRLSIVPGDSSSDCTGELETAPVTPPAGPSITGGTGKAAFSACPSGTCGPTAPGYVTPEYRWRYTIYNISDNDPNIVEKCVWKFGDGGATDILNGSPDDPTDACLEGQYLKHTFPILDNPLECRRYTVSLTIYFNNGFPPEVYSSRFYVPNGTKGNAECETLKYKPFP